MAGRSRSESAATVYTALAEHTLAASSDWSRTDLARMMNGREYKIVVDGDKELLCLHDVLDPQNIEEWTALLDVHQIYPSFLFQRAPELATETREELYRKISTGIARGDVAGTGWESAVVWRSKVKVASESFYRIMGELAVELFSRDRFCGMARQAIEETGPLSLFAHLLFRPSTDLEATNVFLGTSPEVIQFAHFARQIFTPSLSHLVGLFPELDEFLPNAVEPSSPLVSQILLHYPFFDTDPHL